MSVLDEVRRGYEALNRGDPYPFLDLYDPEIELFVPRWVSPDNGLVRGADAVNSWFGNYFAQWTEQLWDVGQALEHGPSAAFAVGWTGRGKRSGVELAGQFLVTMSVQDGRIVTIVLLGGLPTSESS
jgi:ketosteroid isomerase-like protein